MNNHIQYSAFQPFAQELNPINTHVQPLNSMVQAPIAFKNQ